MGKYRVKAGFHVEDGKEYGPGEIVSSKKDLCSIFANKFERVVSAAPEPQEEEETKEKETKEFGNNVTSEFEEAEEKKVLVFRKGRAYTVVDEAEPTLPLHEGTLKKAEVEEFIKGV